MNEKEIEEIVKETSLKHIEQFMPLALINRWEKRRYSTSVISIRYV